MWAYGIHVSAHFPLAGAFDQGALRQPPGGSSAATLEVTLGDVPPPEADDERVVWRTGSSHGEPFSLARLPNGSHVMRWGTRATYVLDPAGTELTCVPDPRAVGTDGENADAAWQRELLDTVLGCVALLRGYAGLHAAAVAVPDGSAVAIVGPSGAGKSTLLAALLARGLPFLTDDILAFRPDASPLVAYAGPPVISLGRPALATASAAVTPVADFGGETWCSLAAGPREAPLGAVVHLRRAPGLPLECRPTAARLRDLLAHTLVLAEPGGQELARLSAAGNLAGVPAFRLTSPPEAPPSDAAEAVVRATCPNRS